ncbi:YlxR family protein [Arthrobacter sp. MSA 4-2]|uniref:YlxR family protein n=3 Tax=Arthrobacter TaxID=1663 RepID=UPI0018E806EE|nr:YlxR family protein [Arthrobacter sp. MSA 4-2]
MEGTEDFMRLGGPGTTDTGFHPIRTCIGCRQRGDQSELMRVVAQAGDEGKVAVLDAHRRLSGRGAWLHPDPACMETALRRKAFHRAFRGAVETGQLALQFHALTGTSNGPRQETVLPESGSEN